MDGPQVVDGNVSKEYVITNFDEHDVQLNKIYGAMENLLDEKAAAVKWNDRQRIGFKK